MQVLCVLCFINLALWWFVSCPSRKNLPASFSSAVKSGDADITTAQCKAYELTNLEHEYEDLSVFTQTTGSGPDYEIPTAQCPAYVPTSQKTDGENPK